MVSVKKVAKAVGISESGYSVVINEGKDGV